MTDDRPNYLQRLLDPPGPPPPLADAGTLAQLAGAAVPVTDRHEIPWPIPLDHLDADAVTVLKRLTHAGYEAYLVGGCVRDLLFGIKPKDFDIATSATPRDVRRLFRNCRIIGRRFRLAHVLFRDKVLEVATFRANAPTPDLAAEALEAAESIESVDQTPDQEAADSAAAAQQPLAAPDGRHGLLIRDDNVFGSAEQDAVRRDFTINALFYDVERALILDFVGGVHDCEQRIIRSIGLADLRMREDPIRMLRAVRLAARLGCRIDAATWQAIEACRYELLHAAAPRILEDLLRMFRGGAIAPAFDLLLESGLLEVMLPELVQHLRARVAQDGADELEALRGALLVADTWAHSGRMLTTPVQLSILLAPVIMTPILDKHGPHGAAGAMPESAEILRPLAQRLAISKRDGERVRQILLNLGKLLPGQRRRRRGQIAVNRRGYFPEALDLFELMSHATGDMVDQAAQWHQQLAATGGGPAEATPAPHRRGGGAAAAPGAPAGGSGRRRRSRRRGR